MDFLKKEYRGQRIEQPKNLSQMIEIAELIAKPFKYARIDLYTVENKVYFGEITFTPCNNESTKEAQYEQGKLLDLPTKYEIKQKNKLGYIKFYKEIQL